MRSHVLVGFSMNILGIDFGQKKIGLAWFQEGLDLVLPFGTIDNRKTILADRQGTVGRIADLIRTERIGKVIIGLPLDMYGRENENTKRVQAFASELRSLVQVPIEFCDELFSSQQADNMGGIVSRDEKSAMVILESYVKQKIV